MTALHVAAFSYNHDLVNALVACGADVHARNRRGAQPLHAAAMGTPGTESWKPLSQAAVVRALVEAGADPDAKAAGGVTPLHRAVRNRCSDAVRELLVLGANPQVRNENDSTPMDLVHATSGRSGSSSAAAKEEQRKIERLLWTLPPTS